MEPTEYLRSLQRRWLIIVAVIVLAAVAAWVTLPDPEEEIVDPSTSYVATHTLLRSITDTVTTDRGSDARIALFVTTGEVPERVVERLELDEPPAIVASGISVGVDNEVGSIRISAEDPDPDRAVLLANTFADETLAYLEQELDRAWREQVEQARQQVREMSAAEQEAARGLRGLDQDSTAYQLAKSQYDSALSRYVVANDAYLGLVDRGPGSLGYLTLEEASPIPTSAPGFQAPRDIQTRIPLAAALGLVLGVALALVLDRIDTRIRNRRSAERAFHLPVVAEVPKLGRRMRRAYGIVTSLAPASAAAEAYRILRLSLQLMPMWVLPQQAPGSSPDEPESATRVRRPSITHRGAPDVVLVTSPGPAEGKTSTVANLATAYAEGGKSVLLLDCDFRGGDLHRYFGLQQTPGLQDFLLASADQRELDRFVQPTGVDGISMIPRGSHETALGELIGPGRELVQAARDMADIVIIDSGPILAVNDPAALIPDVDAVVLTCRSGYTTADAAELTTELLARIEAPVLGVALVGVPEMLGSRLSRSSYRSAPRVTDVLQDVGGQRGGER